MQFYHNESPLAQLFCGMLPPNIPSHAPSVSQIITDGTFILPFIQPTNQSQQDAAAHQPLLGSSFLLSSSLRHQANCLQAFHKTIQQFNQHFKAEHLDRQTLQLIVVKQQNNLTLLRYLLFSPVETISNKVLPLKTPPPALYLTLTLTLTVLHLPSHFLALMDQNFVVLPRWALWDHPERKQAILQTPISSPLRSRRKIFQLRCRTSFQEFQNSKIFSQMKQQLLHLSQRAFILNTFS